MNVHAPPSPTKDVLHSASPEEIRRAIDHVATIRARVIRTGFFGTLLYRPDPAGPDPEEVRERQKTVLREQIEVIHSVCATLKTGSPLPDTSPCISAWLHEIASRDPVTLAEIVAIDRLSRNVLDSALTGGRGQGPALAQHMKTARGGFFEAVTRYCDALWADLAEQQHRELERAQRAADALAKRLDRLESIGQHVRLVSLNASVEAARAGDVGRGLMVIAQEFKALAEEVQQLAGDARADMTEFS